VHQLARAHECLGGHGGNLGGKAIHLRAELRVVEYLPDQTPLRRCYSGELVSEVSETERPLHSHLVHQEPGAAGIRRQSDPGKCLQEIG
jgi:hypothetical protein